MVEGKKTDRPLHWSGRGRSVWPSNLQGRDNNCERILIMCSAMLYLKTILSYDFPDAIRSNKRVIIIASSTWVSTLLFLKIIKRPLLLSGPIYRGEVLYFFYKGKIKKIKKNKKKSRLKAFWVQSDCNFPTTILSIVHTLIQFVCQ